MEGNVYIEGAPEALHRVGVGASNGKLGQFLCLEQHGGRLFWGLDEDGSRYSSSFSTLRRP